MGISKQLTKVGKESQLRRVCSALARRADLLPRPERQILSARSIVGACAKAKQADDLKHLADTLDLHAMALNRMGTFSGLSRIHAMKFYSMANALDSFVRVGQDLADEFLSRFDYDGALDVFERNLLPAIRSKNLMGHVIPVRSHYAVALGALPLLIVHRQGQIDESCSRKSQQPESFSGKVLALH